MKPKKVLFVSILFLSLLLVVTGCRRFGASVTSVPQTSGISMIPEASQSAVSASAATAVSSTENSPDSNPIDSKEIDETLDQILSELTGLDSLYTQMDDVSDTDLNN